MIKKLVTCLLSWFRLSASGSAAATRSMATPIHSVVPGGASLPSARLNKTNVIAEQRSAMDGKSPAMKAHSVERGQPPSQHTADLGNDAPQCGSNWDATRHSVERGQPPSQRAGVDLGHHAPQCGLKPFLLHRSKKADPRDQAALAMLEACGRLFTTGERVRKARNVDELAELFAAVVHTQPQLHDYWIDSQWVKATYPDFVRWAWVGHSLPDHKAFARALANYMFRKRVWHSLAGPEVSQTMYYVLGPRPTAAKANAPGSVEPRASTTQRAAAGPHALTEGQPPRVAEG